MLVTKGIDLEEKLREDLKNKLTDYNPLYYNSYYSEAAETNSTSSRESEDNSNKKTTPNTTCRWACMVTTTTVNQNFPIFCFKKI